MNSRKIVFIKMALLSLNLKEEKMDELEYKNNGAFRDPISDHSRGACLFGIC